MKPIPLRASVPRSAALAACALLVSACGGGSSDGPATPPPEPPLALSCADLATKPEGGLVGHKDVVQSTIGALVVPAEAGGPFESTGSVPATPAYCNVQFTYSSGLQGPGDGYDQGQAQRIKVRVFMPLSQRDGGSGAAQGNWNGKQMVGASGGTSNDAIRWASFAEDTVSDDFRYAIRLGYVGSNTDTGQGNPPFGLISTGALAGNLAPGTIEDWAARGTIAGKRFAAALAKTYYGSTPSRTYFNGCSGAGNQGLGQLQRYGDEYDGALIGAPAIGYNHLQLTNLWPSLVWKKHQLQGHTLPTNAQITAVNAAATASCDVQGADTVADGLVSDPRACTFSATTQICGAPGAPATDCLTAAQAAAVDRIWDGPRNRFGDRIYAGKDRGVPFSPSGTVTGGQLTITWDHKSPSWTGALLYPHLEAIALAGNPAGAFALDDEATLSANTLGPLMDNLGLPQEAFQRKGGKIIHTHGTMDNLITWRNSIDYYRRTATHYGGGQADYAALQQWYRFFPMPGVGHCRGGAGPSAVEPFRALEAWVERGQAPDSLLARATPGTVPSDRTRPLCPFPQTALYKGSGSTDDAANFTCGGNLETQAVVCDNVRANVKTANTRGLDFAAVGVLPAACPALATP